MYFNFGQKARGSRSMGRQFTRGTEEVRVPPPKSVVEIICNAIFISAKIDFFFFFFLPREGWKREKESKMKSFKGSFNILKEKNKFYYFQSRQKIL